MSEFSGPAARPAGWYADPEQPGELRHWDGQAWGKQFKSSGKSSVKSPREPRPVGSGFGRLAAVLGFLLVVVSLIFAARVVLYVWGFAMIGDAVESGDIDLLTTFDDLDQMLSVSIAIVALVTVVCWMIWQYRAARAIPGLERSPAMHAFAWIIPIGSLWLPFQNVRDLINRCVRGRTTLVGWWWTGVLVAGVMGRVTNGAAESASTVAGLRSVLVFAALAGLIGVVAGALSIRIVHAVTAGVRSGEYVDRVRTSSDNAFDSW